MKGSLAALVVVATSSCSATPLSACAAYDQTTQMNAGYRFPLENAGRPGGYGAVSSSPTSMVSADPKQLAGNTSRAVSAVKSPCCSVELITQDCQRVYIRSPTGVFTLKAAQDNGYEMFLMTGPQPPASSPQ